MIDFGRFKMSIPHKLVISTLSEKESMMIEDFSDNRKATYVAEVCFKNAIIIENFCLINFEH